jgi:hypothetical protein
LGTINIRTGCAKPAGGGSLNLMLRSVASICLSASTVPALPMRRACPTAPLGATLNTAIIR